MKYLGTPRSGGRPWPKRQRGGSRGRGGVAGPYRRYGVDALADEAIRKNDGVCPACGKRPAAPTHPTIQYTVEDGIKLHADNCMALRDKIVDDYDRTNPNKY